MVTESTFLNASWFHPSSRRSIPVCPASFYHRRASAFRWPRLSRRCRFGCDRRRSGHVAPGVYLCAAQHAAAKFVCFFSFWSRCASASSVASAGRALRSIFDMVGQSRAKWPVSPPRKHCPSGSGLSPRRCSSGRSYCMHCKCACTVLPWIISSPVVIRRSQGPCPTAAAWCRRRKRCGPRRCSLAPGRR